MMPPSIENRTQPDSSAMGHGPWGVEKRAAWPFCPSWVDWGKSSLYRSKWVYQSGPIQCPFMSTKW